jgi:predicted O-methyltransferase YrrM
MKMTSQQAAPLIADESLGLVFIDVDPHDYEECSRDIGLWLPKVRKGGILSGDDYGENFPGVIRAVDEQFSNINVEVDVSATSKSVWWVLV